MARRQPKQIPQMTVGQFDAAFPHEDACDAYLVARRWPNGVVCPRCGSKRPYELKTMKFKWECPDCSESGYRFSNIAGTIFENTNVDLRQWFRVIHLMLTSKKGISARQIYRYMGFGSYKTAWYMCHRIRAALVEKGMRTSLVALLKLTRPISVARIATGIGTNSIHGNGWRWPARFIVIGAAKRKGNVVARVINNTDTLTLG